MTDLNAKNAWADTQPSQWGAIPGEIEVPLTDVSTEPGALASAAPDAGATAPTRLPLRTWVREGLRAALFRAPRTGAAQPSPWQLLALLVLNAAVTLGAARALVPGPAEFSVRGWLLPQWTTLGLLWFAWWAMAGTRRRAGALSGGVPAWFVLTLVAPLPAVALLYGVSGWAGWKPAFWAAGYWPWVFWGAYALLMAWWLGALTALAGRFIGAWTRTMAFGLALVAMVGVATWQFPDLQPWTPAPRERAEGDAPEPARLHLTQEVFETQQALWPQQVQALAPERPSVVDVYGLVFAPYASEEVFRRESTMVSTLLQQRFDAGGRTLHLLNHAETAGTHLWATPQNLQRAVAALAERMDRESDLLVIYLTSHGARNHALAAWHWPLEVAPLTPEMLRTALDAAGIRHRVIAVSACYAGGWIDPLATDGTLIMTAADATHTSYGCGTKSELTFFGRAVFNEQLRQTHSFTDAFAKAVPLIWQREVEAGKPDGFSNPQIRVGAQIEPVLKALEQRLNAGEGAEADVAVRP